MKSVLVLVLVTSSAAFAGPKWDSVAVFHRPERVVIQINEVGANGRLQNWMTALHASEQVVLQSADGAFKMDCMRNSTAVNCGLRLTPSSQVTIVDKDRTVSARIPLADLKLDSGMEYYEIGFVNANGDHVEMNIDNGEFILNAGKKL